MRLLAISLIATGPVLVGFHQASRGRQLVGQLQALIGALDELEREIGFGQATLLAIFQKSEQPLLRSCAKALGQTRPPSMSRIWSRELEHCFPLLGSAELETAKQVGQVLGRYDTRRQCQALEQAREFLTLAERALREEAQRSGRVNRMLGMAAGALLFIILI